MMEKKAKRKPTGNYPVGFARPPKEHSFPKGKSGNPKGRPRKDKDAAIISPDNLMALLDQPIAVQKNGVVQKLSPIEARAHSLIKKAIVQRNICAIKYILDKAFKYGLLALPKQKQSGGVVTIPRMEGLPDGMERMLALRFGIPEDDKWLPEEIEAIRPHYEEAKKQEEEDLRKRYREEFKYRAKR